MYEYLLGTIKTTKKNKTANKRSIIKKAIYLFLDTKVFDRGYIPVSISFNGGIPIITIRRENSILAISLVISYHGKYITMEEDYERIEDVIDVVKQIKSRDELAKGMTFITVNDNEKEEILYRERLC